MKKIDAEELINLSDYKRVQLIKDLKLYVPSCFNSNVSYELFDSIADRKRLLEKLGLLKEYNNIYLDFRFEFSKKRLKESIYKAIKRKASLSIQKKMLSVFSDIVYYAIPIETHKDIYEGTVREDITLDKVYVLLSSFKDDKYIYPVELIIKKFIDKNNTIYLAIAMNEIKKTQFQPSLDGIHWDTISVSNLIKRINDGDFLKYIPDCMLTSKQRQYKEEAIFKEKIKIDSLNKHI